MSTLSDPVDPKLTRSTLAQSSKEFDPISTCLEGPCTETAAPSDESRLGETTSGAVADQTSSAAADGTPSADINDGTGSTIADIISQTSQPRSTTAPLSPGMPQSSSRLSSTSLATPVATPTTEVSLQTDKAGSRGDNSGLSSGAVAGIAISTLIAGAAIAFLAAFFLFKRRSRMRESNVANKDYNSYADSTPDFVMMHQQKNAGMGGRNSPYVQVSQTATPAPAIVPASLSSAAQPTDGSNIAAFLPPATPESKVYNKLMALFRECHSHIETFYRDVHASITPSMEPNLAQFGANDVNMAELLQDCSSPTTVLKHAIVAYVLGITIPRSGEAGESLYPEELKELCGREAAGESVDPNVTAASALHRRLSVYLYNAAAPARQSRGDHSIHSNAHEAAENFSLAFFPWADPSASDQDRDEALAGLIQFALDINIWLHGEPAHYEFEWEETGRRGILVSPSLIRWTGRVGDSNRKVVVEGVVMAV